LHTSTPTNHWLTHGDNVFGGSATTVLLTICRPAHTEKVKEIFIEKWLGLVCDTDTSAELEKITFEIEQGSPNHGPRSNFVNNEKVTHLRKIC